MRTDATPASFNFPGIRMRRRRTVAAQTSRAALIYARHSPPRVVAHALYLYGQRACSDLPAPCHIFDTPQAPAGGRHGR